MIQFRDSIPFRSYDRIKERYGFIMKIGEARMLYSSQLHSYQEQKLALARQKKELEKKANAVPNGKELYEKEGVALELSYNAVSEKYDEYKAFMEKLMELHTAYFNAEASKQQGEAMAEYAEDLAKIMEVARRIADGDRVPAYDEQKLMEYSMELYMSAKNIAIMNENKDKEEYDSLWADEEEKKENPDPFEAADSKELSLDAPEIVDAGDVAASASAPTAGASILS